MYSLNSEIFERDDTFLHFVQEDWKVVLSVNIIQAYTS